MRTNDEQMLQLHRARTKLINFKVMALKIMQKCQPIKKEDFEVMLEASRVSEDYQDVLTLHNLVTTLGVEQSH
jgi:hypothetical protein